MKYCVFGFKEKCPKAAKAKNNLSTDPFSFEKSLKSYQFAVESLKYSKVYFLVDFGYGDIVPFYKSISIDEANYNIIPWILIEQSTISDNDVVKTNDAIHGKICLKLKGFTETFEDSIKAFERFDYYYRTKIKCELYCGVFDKDNVFITDTKKCMKISNDINTKYCRKFRI